MNSSISYPFADLALSQRLERAEAQSNAEFIDTRARITPATAACRTEVAGTVCLYDGPESPCTQTFGLGLEGVPTPDDWRRIEDFFRERGAAVHHEVSPLAAPELWPQLHQRGYEAIEFTSLLFRPIWPELRLKQNQHPNADVHVRIASTAADLTAWQATAVGGWDNIPAAHDLLADLMRVSAQRKQGVRFLAEVAGEPAAAGILILCGRTALLGGASTLPAFRKRGAQLSLLEARLRFAADAGCDLAMICAQPGSGSQRNAERHDFRIAYTRIKWRLGL